MPFGPHSGGRVRLISPGSRAAAALFDQGFAAGANAVNGLLAGFLLGPASYGRYVAVIGIALIALAVSRAFIGEVLLTHTARVYGAEHHTQARNAATTAFGVGLIGMAVAGGLWLFGFDLLRDLLWLAPFLPSALLADASRYAFLSRRRPQRSMVITGVALLVQLAVVAGLVLTGNVWGGPLLAAWGIGASVGALVGLVMLRIDPLRGRPRQWISATRHLSGWFVASAALSQAYTWIVLYFVGGHLGAADLGGLRMLQMLVLMPVQNFIWALTGMIVPGYSSFAEKGDRARIRRRTRGLVGGFAAVAVLLLALAPLGELVVEELLPAYRPYQGLIVPLALQAGLYLVQSPLNAALRGMQQARRAFLQYAAFAAAILPASLTGAVLAGVRGAAWGMVLGAAVGGMVAYLHYRRALREVRPIRQTVAL
ncbi:MAG: hypothetical protein ACRDT1_12915 [Micromonosporaceae bacterium]